MSTPFDESKHPREADGTFAQKSYADPGQLDLDQTDYDPAWGEGVRREVDEEGNVFYLRGDQLHRENGPAVERADGTRLWHVNDQLHRTGGPAIEHADGARAWYHNDELHRTDGPAVEHADGTQEFWIDGRRVEPDDPRLQLPGRPLTMDGRQLRSGVFWIDGKRVEPNDPRLQIPDPAWGEGVQRKVYGNGDVRYLRGDELHREDGPAVEYADGGGRWYQNNRLHREDGPAVEWDDGTRWWYQNNRLHRLGGPAVEWPDGTREFWIDGGRVQSNDPRLQIPDPAWGEGVRRKVHEDGSVFYLRGDDLHRENGPADERANGDRYWYRNNQLHRLDGPAIEYADGVQEFYINGRYVEPDDPRLQLPGRSLTVDGRQFWSGVPDNPSEVAVRSDKPLSDEDMNNMAELIGYQYAATVGGERPGYPVRVDDRTFTMTLDLDGARSSDPNEALVRMQDKVAESMSQGSPVRTTDRAGAGTKGTRLVGPVGDFKAEFLYDRTEGSTPDARPKPQPPKAWSDFKAGGGFYDREAVKSTLSSLPEVNGDSPSKAWDDYQLAEQVGFSSTASARERQLARSLAASAVARIDHMLSFMG